MEFQVWNFYDCFYAFLHTKPLLKWIFSKRGANSFLSDPFFRREKNIREYAFSVISLKVIDFFHIYEC